MQREYRVLYQEVEDGWIMASVPDLPGAVTQGRDRDEARMMIREAVELLLESYREEVAKRLDSNGRSGTRAKRSFGDMRSQAELGIGGIE